MESTKLRGLKTEMWVQAALTEINLYTVEIRGDYLRYDLLIILDDGSIRRVQCKHSNVLQNKKYPNSAIGFNTATRHNRTIDGSSISVGYKYEADLFGTYNTYTRKCYLIPVNDTMLHCTLRLEPPRNNQFDKVRMASDYEITPENSKRIHEMVKNCGFSIRPVDEPVDNKIIYRKADPAMIMPNAPKNCLQCGKEYITNYATETDKRTFCSIGCYRLYCRRFVVSREALEKLVWEKPTEQVGKDFGVSGKAVEKRCKLLGIKKPPRGYWAQKSAKDKKTERGSTGSEPNG